MTVRFVVAVAAICAAAVLPAARADAACTAGVDYAGGYYEQTGGDESVPSAQLGSALTGAQQPVCRDTVVVSVDAAGNTVTAAPPTSERPMPLPARAISGVAPRLAIAVRRDGDWTVQVRTSVCRGVPPSRVLGCLRARSRYALQIDRAVAEPGDIVRVRVRAPRGSPSVSGVHSYLLGERKGSWVPLFDLFHGVDGPPRSEPYVRNRVKVLRDAPPGRWLTTLVPDVPPGRYRILHDFGSQRLVVDLRIVAP